MKIIKINTNLELTTHEFPEGSIQEQNDALRDLIGDGCGIYERVMPRRLYTDLHMEARTTGIPGQCVSMLVDGEGLSKDSVSPNPVGCYLYETDKHGCLIVGNILFVGEKWDDDGIDFCGIDRNVFDVLEAQLKDIIYKMKRAKGAMRK